MQEIIKPCPICGSKSTLTRHIDNNGLFFIFCNENNHNIYDYRAITRYGTTTKAIRKWNEWHDFLTRGEELLQKDSLNKEEQKQLKEFLKINSKRLKRKK
jgi:hypothetical protein